MISGLTFPHLASLLGPKLALLPLTFLLNAALAWSARDLAPAALAALIFAVSGAEAYLWLRVVAGPAAARPIEEPRLAALMSRTAAVRQNSLRDEATGLYNRWYLDMRLEEEAARCRRYDLSMAVVVLRAGLVNLGDISLDSWQGRSSDIGQNALKVISMADLSASIAPFEFAICLVHCDRDGAEHAVERLKAQLSDFNCNAGIALYPEDDCEPRVLIELARVRSRGGGTA